MAEGRGPFTAGDDCTISKLGGANEKPFAKRGQGTYSSMDVKMAITKTRLCREESDQSTDCGT